MRLYSDRQKEEKVSGDGTMIGLACLTIWAVLAGLGFWRYAVVKFGTFIGTVLTAIALVIPGLGWGAILIIGSAYFIGGFFRR